MGKRELVLVIGFAVAGVVLYQITAPPALAGAPGFSISRLVDHLRRHIRGNSARAEVQSTRTEPVDASVDELRLAVTAQELTIVGEARRDVSFDLTVTSTGYDEAEAKQHAEAAKLTIDRAGSAIAVKLKYPPEGRQRARLGIKVPARLRVRIERSDGRLEVAHVAALEASTSGAGAAIRDVAGPVTVNQRGGPVSIDGAGSLRLTARGGNVKVQNITGLVTVQSFSGELSLAGVVGPVEIDARNTNLRLDALKALKPPLRVTATNGSVRIAGLRTEARLDGNDAELDVALDAPAPVAAGR
jgi:hypothetical protein